MSKIDVARNPSALEKGDGYDLTSHMMSKIAFGSILKDDNISTVPDELTMRGVSFLQNANWTTLIKLLKENEGDNDEKCFFPKIGMHREDERHIDIFDSSKEIQHRC